MFSLLLAALLCTTPSLEEPLPPGFVRIHLDSAGRSVRLYRQGEHGEGETPAPLGQLLHRDRQLCSAPCGVQVDVRPGTSLYLGGPGMPSTPSFQLVGRSGDVVIEVHGGSYGKLFGGGVSAWGGLVGVLAGGSVLTLGLILGTSSSSAVQSAGGVLTVGGGVVLGLGVAFGATGLYLLHTGQTRFQILPSGTRPPSNAPSDTGE